MGERGWRWQGRQSSEGLYFKIHPRLSRQSYRQGDGFFHNSETKRDDKLGMTKQKLFIRFTSSITTYLIKKKKKKTL